MSGTEEIDGWRVCVHTAAGITQSRQGNDLAYRFPEIVAAGHELGDAVVDFTDHFGLFGPVTWHFPSWTCV